MRDAADLARWLIGSGGWGPKSVLLLTDQDPAALGFDEPAARPLHRRPTKANLDWGARQWLGSEARPGDVLVVFFAGQAIGLPDPDPTIDRASPPATTCCPSMPVPLTSTRPDGRLGMPSKTWQDEANSRSSACSTPRPRAACGHQAC